MIKPTVRSLDMSDFEAVSALWQSCFGDDPELVRVFLEKLRLNGLGFGAFFGNVLCGMAFLMLNLELSASEESIACGYVYAVATREEYRRMGIAELLCGKCREAAEASGCRVILVKPVSEKLYNYYGKILGTDTFIRCRRESFRLSDPSCAPVPVKPVSAAEYGAMREVFLSSSAHFSVSVDWLEYEKALCQSCGGNLYSVGGRPAAAYTADGVLSVKELLCPLEERDALLSSLCMYHNVSEAELSLPCETGEKYLAADSGIIPPLCRFGILFD